jgi:hypothetical protein
MSTIGQEILEGLRETRKFFEQVSLLIITTEGLLGQSGWNNALPSSKSFNITSDFNQPKKWMPRLVSRFYKNEEVADILVYTGVLLDPEIAWQGFEEPWFTCGLFQFVPGKLSVDYDSLSWVTEHLEAKLEPNGNFYKYLYNKKDPKEWEEGVLRLSMAVPLVEFKNPDDIKNKAIDRLFGELNGENYLK